MKFDSLVKNEGIGKNYEGGEAFRMDAYMELYTAVVASTLSATTYEQPDDRVKRISELVKKVDAEFVAKLAVYTRTMMNLRSVPLLLAVELAKVHNGDDLVARTVGSVVLRADEIMELLTCYQWRRSAADGYKKLGHLSRQIQNGLGRSFNNFNEYQFAKYNNSSREVKLRDALFLVHPKAKDDNQQAIFNKIASNTLDTPYTWETELSALGQKQFDSEEDKRKAFSLKWQELIASGKLGYMAIMRNLRNIITSKDMPAEVINEVIKRLTDKQGVRNSKQLPFRFLSAYREVSRVDSVWTQSIMDALEDAIMISADNIEGFDYNTRVFVAADASGSMTWSVSPRSTVRYYDIGFLLAMMLKSCCSQVIGGMFGDIWKTINLPSGKILSNVEAMYKRMGEVGYSTNGHLAIDWLCDEKVVMDKVFFFTDCQLWDSNNENASLRKSWKKYKTIAPKAKLYLFDLGGYGQSPLSLAEKDVYLIAGWSDKIFDILSAIEKGSSAIEEIQKIQI